MIASMLIQACYNIVDSYFVSKLSEDALNAVSLAFPVQNLMIAVAVGTRKFLCQWQFSQILGRGILGILLASLPILY